MGHDFSPGLLLGALARNFGGVCQEDFSKVANVFFKFVFPVGGQHGTPVVLLMQLF